MAISPINILSSQPSNGRAIFTQFLDTVPRKGDIRWSTILVFEDFDTESFLVAFTPGIRGADFDRVTRVVIKVYEVAIFDF
ncbi:MAG: hypothetical protein F6K37_05670 [Moorea sp. SIO4E2]|nr:hypothetical protein [Moorena sp. SIO4E2]